MRSNVEVLTNQLSNPITISNFYDSLILNNEDRVLRGHVVDSSRTVDTHLVVEGFLFSDKLFHISELQRNGGLWDSYS